MLPRKLHIKIEHRKKDDTLRALSNPTGLVDFSSNDYLGFAKQETISQKATLLLKQHQGSANGATGSRLLSGNHPLFTLAEQKIAQFHQSEAALLFNSGYDANIGFFQSVPQRGDFILFDEYVHASIRDGIQISKAKAYKFEHNNLESLQQLVIRLREMHHLSDQSVDTVIYVVTESVFSMDGDSPALRELLDYCKKEELLVVVDEAHATGVMGAKGAGLVQDLHAENEVFARIITFGKALGCHGAAILCNLALQEYLINFARSFIYTTGLPPHSVATLLAAYAELENPENTALVQLRANIRFFKNQLIHLALEPYFIPSISAIQSAIIPNSKQVKGCAAKLMEAGYEVKPILAPTVPLGQERLRFCLHSYTQEKEMVAVLSLLSKILKDVEE